MTASAPAPKDRQRTPIFWIAVSAAVLIAASVVGGSALMAVSAKSLDRLVAQDERRLVQRTLDRDLARMTREVTSATVWDEAVERMSGQPDLAWADVNFADYYHRYFGHDLSYVIRDGTVIYASLAGGRVSTPSLGALPGDSSALARSIADQALRARQAGRVNLAGEVARSGLLRSGGDVYLVVAAAITPETAAHNHLDPADVVISVRRINATFLKESEADLGLPGLRLDPADTGLVTGAPLVDLNGRPIGQLTWSPRKPGMVMVRTLAPWLAGIFAILAAASVAIGYWIRVILRRMREDAEALRAARDAAEGASAAKSLFLANMSHEIRTPLNGVLGMAQVMAHDELPERQASRLQIIQDSATALLQVLNGIIEASRLESGKVALQEETFDLKGLAQSSCAVFTGAAAAKGVALRAEVAAELDGLWQGDAGKIRQVLSNLVANAIKFTPKGAVTLRVAAAGRQVRFEVRDTGVGIAPEHLDKLFQVFSQVDDSYTRAHDGAGLGLAICRELVQLMGGEIGVESTPGRGSVFHVELPLSRLQTPAAQPKHPEEQGAQP